MDKRQAARQARNTAADLIRAHLEVGGVLRDGDRQLDIDGPDYARVSMALRALADRLEAGWAIEAVRGRQ